MTVVWSRFHPATRLWFSRTFAGPTPIQEQGWDSIARGQHTLLLAPTGSGKTLSAFLWSIDRLLATPRDAPGVRVLYVSPLKALVYDVERNLRAPLQGVVAAARTLGEPVADITVSVRTGDSSARDRRRLATHPGDILVTTPESLFLLLTTQAREVLRSVETVIVDEIHAVAGTKRGVHLALSLERLSHLCANEPQRVGLSATQRPLSAIATFLGGDRPVQVVDASAPPSFDLEIVVPVADMDQPVYEESAKGSAESGLLATGVHAASSLGMDRAGIWPAIQPRILDLIAQHRTTIVFTNSRRLCERLAQRLNELAAERGRTAPICRAHHGSVSHKQRLDIEEALKSGQIPAIIATSSLELGIDMGTVDLVVQVAAPHSVSSGLQRIGRAGHGVGQQSKARIFPRFKGDLLLAAAVAQGMRCGDVESTSVPKNPLDVLAQQIAAMCVVDDLTVSDVYGIVRRASPYFGLSHDSFTAVIDLLCGTLPQRMSGVDPDAERELAYLRPLLSLDHSTGRLSARPATRLVVVANAGTIPDRGLFGVFVAPDGPRVGELDEEMVYESRKGDVVLLGATSWRIVDISRDRVLVAPAPGEPGRMPFWRGEGPGRAVDVGKRIGALIRDIQTHGTNAVAFLQDSCGLDALAAGNLVGYVADQEARGAVPTDQRIVVERFRDEFGDWRICILSPFGGRVHAPWALAILARLEVQMGTEVQCLWSDDGIVLRIPDAFGLPSLATLLPGAEDVRELVVAHLRHSAVFGARFREAAARALVLPRRHPGDRRPLWMQRLRAQSLLQASAALPTFPVTLEAYRECLHDVFDLDSLEDLLARVAQRKVRVTEVETDTPSPFARSLIFAFVANWLYEGDAPLAERRAAALSIDRSLLQDLLGEDELRSLIPEEVLGEVERELQRLAPELWVQHIDGLEDLLRRLGDLSVAELAQRCREGAPVAEWVSQLEAQGRAVRVELAGAVRVVVPEDAVRFSEAVGSAIPAAVPASLRTSMPHALTTLVARYARTHTLFSAAQISRRWGIGAAPVGTVLVEMAARGTIVDGFGEHGVWCDREVLRRLKRRALAQLRGAVEPVDAPTLAAFLPVWQGVGDDAPDRLGRLREVITQLEGCALPWSDVERLILPQRVRGFTPELLDTLSASGELAWVGAGPLGSKDGRVRLFWRESLGTSLAGLSFDGADVALDASQRTILDLLQQRGAQFTVELQGALQGQWGRDELDRALWGLVWAGQVSNDTFGPLRQLGRRKAPTAVGRPSWRRGTPGSGAYGGSGGRWWSLQPWRDAAEDKTVAISMWCQRLLDRHGVVGREVALAEEISGGFQGLYAVLREMEDLGHVRRGWFVAGLGGAQFAFPGVVDQLRASRGADRVIVLSACDPAQPYGAAMPWPPRGGAPRREAGARVVLVAGHIRLWLARGASSMSVWPDPEDKEPLLRAVQALREHRTQQRSPSLRVTKVNGVPWNAGPWGAFLRDAGWKTDGDALVLEVPP